MNYEKDKPIQDYNYTCKEDSYKQEWEEGPRIGKGEKQIINYAIAFPVKQNGCQSDRGKKQKQNWWIF